MFAAADEKFFAIDNIEDLYLALTKRKHWNKVRPEILRKIVDNAKGDNVMISTLTEWSATKKIQRFVAVSEQTQALENNLLSLGKDPNSLEAVSYFAAVMSSVGTTLGDTLDKLPAGSEQQQAASILTEMALQSAILCNPFQLAAYIALAYYYVVTSRRDIAGEVCKEYHRMTQVLAETPEDSLSYTNKVLKRNESGLLSKVEQGIGQIEREYSLRSGH